MKRISSILIIALIAVLAPLASKAQFRYGPAAGITVNNLSLNQELFSHSSLVAPMGGVMGEFMFGGIGFGVDFSLFYNQIGMNSDLTPRKLWADQGFGDAKLRLHTLQIPLNLRFKWTRMDGFEDYLAPFIFAGPVFDITLAESKIPSTKNAPSPFARSGGDVGLSTGLGVEIFRNWQLSGQYTWGLTSMTGLRELPNFTGENRQWTVRLAYLF